MKPSSPRLSVACVYDGSVGAHWIVRYAARLAGATTDRALRLVRVPARDMSQQASARRLENVLGECERAGITVSVEDVDLHRDLSAAILDRVPAGSGSFLVCGAQTRRGRAKERLAGTLAERLLRTARCNVLALRILMPGLLGVPRKLLLPVACNPGEARAVEPFLRLMLPSADELHVLRAMLTGTTRMHRARYETLARLRAHGQAAVTHFETELRAVLPVEGLHLDTYVRIAEEWTRPAIVLASQHHCDLVLAGASDQELASGSRRKRLLERLLEQAPCDVGLYRAGA